MTAEDILLDLFRLNIAVSGAVLVVLALRGFVRLGLGAGAAYRMWLVVPIAAAACLLPARERIVLEPPLSIAEAPQAPAPATTEEATPGAAAAAASATPTASIQLPSLPDTLFAVWLLGAAALLALSIARTRRLANDPSVGPALVGVLRPRLILPADFETRFSAQERALILAHEEVHRARGHTLVNGLIEVARCLCWFNPLAHNAAVAIRADQELACDAAVIAAHPAERRAYGEALLKTLIAPRFLPLGCTWPSRSSKRLKERIEMLAQPAPARWRAILGAAVVAAVGGGLGYAAWAQQPPLIVPPDAVWTPSADAPAGLLTPLEVQRHDLFIELARTASPCPGSPSRSTAAVAAIAAGAPCTAGEGIDIVLFGTTNTEMFWWPDRGMPVWRETLGLRKAVNFGSQGSRRESLLWRMQNGELDGYSAKIVVLQAYSHRDDVVTELGPVIEEIRARQPQAKILIFADFPRGQQSLESWRELAAESAAAAAPLVDDETVFYIDIGERFFLPDGSHNQEMWRFPPVSGLENVGMQASGFEVWAEELEPWLDRFVG